MQNTKQKSTILTLSKSKFVRSVFFQVLSIFLIVVLLIIAFVFFSFSSEITKSIVLERQKNLETIESSISQRMDEISSISYNISTDKSFYLEPISGNRYSGYEMSKTLDRYLVGNDFIEHLAYYRLSEPDTIYVSTGELSFIDFWRMHIGFDTNKAKEIISEIQNVKKQDFFTKSFYSSTESFVTYICPLPLFSTKPQAFVLMLIPSVKVYDILKTQLANSKGQLLVFDAEGTEKFKISTIEEEIPFDYKTANSEDYISYGGKKYVLQKKVSEENGWVYVSIIRLDAMFSRIATKQTIFIILLLVVMIAAIGFILLSIVRQYEPINNLAMSVAGGGTNDVIDEETVLSDTFAALKDDSEQKQKFEVAYNEATAANKAKSAFLSNMSHDIRTPMNAIIGMTEIALKHTDDVSYVKSCLQKVRVSSQYLLDIINNVLDMSKIESGKFTLSNGVIDLSKLVYGMITILNQSLEVKSLKMIVDVTTVINEKVQGDTVRLTQVFMNILSNAIKFTPNGGTITFTINQFESSAEGYGEYAFVFTDTGIGMSDAFIHRVFDTFARDENSVTAKIDGTGLGMSIAKNLVDLMGGTIKCESSVGKGTMFTVSLRMKLAEEKKAEQKREKEETYSDESVLIVGKENQVCRTQIELFSELGVFVDYAHDADSAGEKIEHSIINKTPYSFVIINQAEEDKSGIDTIAKLTHIHDVPDMTYVFVARNILEVERSSALNSGIDAVLQAPLFRSSVRGILNKTFKHQDKHAGVCHINLEGKRILLVEDNLMNREIAHTMISETNALVVEAVNGKEAVEAFKNNDVGYFDLIFMDVQMPVMNGYEATAAIRSIQRKDAKTIPIYAMTANTFDEDVRQVKDAGMNGHIGKPYSSNELYTILEQTIFAGK